MKRALAIAAALAVTGTGVAQWWVTAGPGAWR